MTACACFCHGSPGRKSVRNVAILLRQDDRVQVISQNAVNPSTSPVEVHQYGQLMKNVDFTIIVMDVISHWLFHGVFMSVDDVMKLLLPYSTQGSQGVSLLVDWLHFTMNTMNMQAFEEIFCTANRAFERDLIAALIKTTRSLTRRDVTIQGPSQLYHRRVLQDLGDPGVQRQSGTSILPSSRGSAYRWRTEVYIMIEDRWERLLARKEGYVGALARMGSYQDPTDTQYINF